MEQIVFLRLAITVAVSGLGALIAILFKKINHLGFCVLISFAAGALLAVTFLDILPEAVEIAGVGKGILSFASGYLLFILLSRFVSHICPACSATHSEINFRALTMTMVVALSVHSLMDGLAVFGGSVGHQETGLALLLAVAFHKLPEGLALALVAMNSGMNRPAAFVLSLGLETATTLLGGMAGIWLGIDEHASWVGMVLGHAGGGFFFIAWHALLSEVIKHHPKHTLVAALLGASAIGAVHYFHG